MLRPGRAYRYPPRYCGSGVVTGLVAKGRSVLPNVNDHGFSRNDGRQIVPPNLLTPTYGCGLVDGALRLRFRGSDSWPPARGQGPEL